MRWNAPSNVENTRPDLNLQEKWENSSAWREGTDKQREEE